MGGKATVKDRLEKGVVVSESTGCWEWTRYTNPQGSGRMGGGVGRGLIYTHRASYETYVGPIPEGMLVCHHCDNPPCCNPAHLFIGTYRDNANDCEAKGRNRHILAAVAAATAERLSRTRCRRGHSFDDENTYFRKTGGRACRACQRVAMARRRNFDKILERRWAP